MSHASALDRLLSLGGELVTTPGAPRRKFDLAHMRALLAAVGDPHHRFDSVLIAGTNGKGSTAATLAAILAAAGYSTGLYTSPHLTRINERIKFLGPTYAREIDDAKLLACFAEVERAAKSLVDKGTLPMLPSFFETITTIAMLAFADLTVNIAVLEVGMGGRLDATNVVEPLVSIITDISLDHTEWLGTTIAEIAREKAGILRRDGIMVTLPQHPEANQALGEVAVALNARGVNAADFLPGREADSVRNDYVLSTTEERIGGTMLCIASPLQGRHQQRNIALALAAAAELRNAHGYEIDAAAIEQGIASTIWPGRFETLAATPGRPAFLLDVAHNPAGAWALRSALGAGDSADDGRQLVFGCMRDKALVEIAQILFPIFSHVYLTELPSPRSATTEELAAAAALTGVSYTVFSNPAPAIHSAIASSLTGGAPMAQIVVSGSVILVGAARDILL